MIGFDKVYTKIDWIGCFLNKLDIQYLDRYFCKVFATVVEDYK